MRPKTQKAAGKSLAAQPVTDTHRKQSKDCHHKWKNSANRAAAADAPFLRQAQPTANKSAYKVRPNNSMDTDRTRKKGSQQERNTTIHQP